MARKSKKTRYVKKARKRIAAPIKRMQEAAIIQNPQKKNAYSLWLMGGIALLLIAVYLIGPAFTGFLVARPSQSQNDTLNLIFNESQSFVWKPKVHGELQSLKAKGTIIGNGTARIMVRYKGQDYVIYEKGMTQSNNLITGLAIESSNTAPEWDPRLKDISIKEMASIDLKEHVSDAENDQLTFSPSTMQTADVVVTGSLLLLSPKEDIQGEESLTIAAFDGKELSFKVITIIINTTKEQTIENDADENILNENPINETPQIDQAQEIAIDEMIEQRNNTEIIENLTITGENETRQNTINETIDEEKTINNALEYGTDPNSDPDDDGFESLKGTIDLRTKASFNWDVNETNLCTRWSVQSQQEQTFICYGNAACCSFVELLPSREQWNESFYGYYSLLGMEEVNIVSSQVIYADLEKAQVVSSGWANRSMVFREEASPFDSCIQTCALPDWNASEYLLTIELENASIDLKSLSYSFKAKETAPIQLIRNISNITIFQNEPYRMNLHEYFSGEDLNFDNYKEMQNINVTISEGIVALWPAANFTGVQYLYFIASNQENEVYSNIFRIDVIESNATPITIGKPVQWKKTISVNESGLAQIELPLTSSNISVYSATDLSPIAEESITISKDNEKKTLQQYEAEQEQEKYRKQQALIDRAIQSNAQKVVIEDQTLNHPELHNKSLELNQKIEDIQIPAAEQQTSGLGLISGNAVLQEELPDEEVQQQENSSQATTLIIESTPREIILEYMTQAPSVLEIPTANGKRITIVSDEHYENVAAYTEIEDAQKEHISLYWIQNESRFLFENVTYLDSNLNGKIDRLEWIVPHLSNQTFEVSITILNVQSYPMVQGNWTVLFNTTGIGNLTILASNGTTYSDLMEDNGSTANDLIPLSLVCSETAHYSYYDSNASASLSMILQNGSKMSFLETANHSYALSGIYFEDYSCNATSLWTTKVLTPGKHHQQFNFSGMLTFAHNDASCDCPASGAWTVNAAANCQTTATCDMQNNDVICTGTGSWDISAPITNVGNVAIHPGCTIVCRNSGGCFQ